MAGAPTKEAVIYLVDVSSSMGHTLHRQPDKDIPSGTIKKELLSQTNQEPQEEGQADAPRTKLDLARQALLWSVHQKALGKPKSTEVAVILYGSDHTKNLTYEQMDDDGKKDYEHIEEVLSLTQPSVASVKLVDTDFPSVPYNRSADLVGALVTAVHTMREYTGKRRCQRKIVLMTDLESRLKKDDSETLKELVDQMKEKDMHLTFVGFDMTQQEVTGKAEAGHTQGDKMLKIKQENEKMISSVVKEVGGECIDVLTYLDSLQYFTKKTKSATYNLTIQLTSKLEFGAKYGGATMEARPPTLSKAHKQSVEQGQAGDIHLDYTYHSAVDELEVKYEDRGKGYPYGPEFVPYTADELEQFKMLSDKAEMKILAFVPESDVPRHVSMSNVVFVHPNPSDMAGNQVLSAFVTALHDAKKLAIVRFVRKKNADPEIGALVPVTNRECPFFYYHKLPFRDDTRSYRFPSLLNPMREENKPNEEELKAASDLVDSLFVNAPLPECCNPTLYRVNKTVAARSLDPEAPIEPVHPSIRRMLEPDPSVWNSARTTAAAAAFTKAFPVTKVESKRARAAKDSVWGQKGMMEEEGQMDAKRARTDQEVAPAREVRLTSVNALKDFPAIIEGKEEAEIKEAINQMKELVRKLAEENLAKDKAFELVVALRKGCVDSLEHEAFNQFLRELLDQLKPGDDDDPGTPFWHEMGKQGVSLITAEDGLSDDGVASKEEAEALLKAMVEKAHTEIKAEVPMDEGDADLDLE